MSQTEKPESDLEQPFISHLVELRQRLVHMVFAILAIFALSFPFANELYTFLADPLMKHLPEGTSMIATDVASPFLTPFKLTLVLSIFVSMPYILYQLWGFIAPGLYQNERRLVLPLVASSTILYYLGMAFAYFVVFPLMFGFFVSVAPEGVAVMTDIAKYLDFVLKLFFAFGVAFEVPVATVLLVITGITTPDALAEKRPYMIVGVFVLAMLLTPPDVISQTLLALPVLLLFEVGILAARFVTRNKVDEYADPEPDPDPSAGPAKPPPSPPSSPAPTSAPAAGTARQSGTAQPGVSHPGAAEAAAAGLAALNAPMDVDAEPEHKSEEQHQADTDAGLHDGEHEDEEEDWEEGDDELDRAIAEQEVVDAAADGTETDPPIDWDNPDGRFTEDGLDEELDLMDGDLDVSPPRPKPAEEPATGELDDAASEAGDNTEGDEPPAVPAVTSRLEILPADTRPDPGKPGWTIPRTYGVWELPESSSGKRYRFGNYPVRGKELEREFGEVSLVKLYTARLAAKENAGKLN